MISRQTRAIRVGAAAIAWFFVLLVAGARAGELQADLAARRARLMERLGPHTMLVAFGAPVRTYSHDIPYEYRQNSDFYYLTGVDQPESILVLMPGNVKHQAILFIVEPDPIREHWDGPMLRTEEATRRSGIERVLYTSQFEPFVNATLAGRRFEPSAEQTGPEYVGFFKALRAGDARVSLVLGSRPALGDPPGEAHAFATRVRERFLGVAIHDATTLVHELRQVKSAYEQRVLEQSVRISSEAQLAGMRAARPGAYEYEVEAAIEYTYLKNGALGWGYPSIVGSGPNATILHYHASRRRMEPGELLLVDAAANYEYMTGDITRTYPISGTFSETQKDIYRLVLAAQDQAMQVARAGRTTRDVHARTVEVIKEGLLKLGLITDVSGDQYRTWYTHGSVHFIGIDVHDVGDLDRPLEPGMAFVIEPGIYIREGALDRLPPTPENRAFAEKVRPAYEKYKHIGVRIEDSFLLTEAGLKRLSAGVPRTIEDIEQFMQSRATSQP